MNDILFDIVSEMSLIEEYFQTTLGISLSECEEILQEGDKWNRLWGKGTAGIRYVKNKDTGKIEARRTGLGRLLRKELTDTEITRRIEADAKKRVGGRPNDDKSAIDAAESGARNLITKRLDSKKSAAIEKINADEDAEKKKKEEKSAKKEYTSATKEGKNIKTIQKLLQDKDYIDDLSASGAVSGSSDKKYRKKLKKWNKQYEKAKEKGLIDQSQSLDSRSARDTFRKNVLDKKIDAAKTATTDAESKYDTAKKSYTAASKKAKEADRKLSGYKSGYANN